MKNKRMLSMLLAALLFLSACAGTPQNAEEPETASAEIGATAPEEAAVPETEPELSDAVPQSLDFGGADFVFLANSMYGAPSLVEGTNGEIFNDATYDVELYTEDRLNVNISEVLNGSMLTAPDLDKSGAVQEVMCCAGYKTMLPAYIDSAMKNKVARNQESADAIQIIYDTRTRDLAKLYLPTCFDTSMYSLLRSGKGVVSSFEKKRSKIEDALQKVIGALTTKAS